MQLILASKSPRRAELLRQVGADFSIRESNTEEILSEGLTPDVQVAKLALQKATAVAEQTEDGIVIGADTIVVQGDTILGKPKTKEDAIVMLRNLSGDWHMVMTGVALVHAKQNTTWTTTEITRVKFRALSEADILAYVATGESMDKAGAYGIQGAGALLVERIEGCYFNVVGLPLQRLAEGLQTMGVNLYAYSRFGL